MQVKLINISHKFFRSASLWLAGPQTSRRQSRGRPRPPPNFAANLWRYQTTSTNSTFPTDSRSLMASHLTNTFAYMSDHSANSRTASSRSKRGPRMSGIAVEPATRCFRCFRSRRFRQRERKSIECRFEPGLEPGLEPISGVAGTGVSVSLPIFFRGIFYGIRFDLQVMDWIVIIQGVHTYYRTGGGVSGQLWRGFPQLENHSYSKI